MPTSQSPAKVEQVTKKQPERKSQVEVSAPELTGIQAVLRNPQAAQTQDILRLQRMAGNRAVTQLLQRKVTVGAAHDQYEQEADRVAQQVMRAPVVAPLQRQGEEKEEIQAKPLATTITPLVQRALEDEEELQTKPASGGEAFAPGADFEQQLAAQKSGGQPLPGITRAFMERRFGANFSGVRIHADGAAAQLNRQVQAQAFTQGSDIFMGAGKYDPQSESGKELLAHELTHTIQQGASPASQTSIKTQILEAQSRASQKLGGQSRKSHLVPAASVGSTIQRVPEDDGEWRRRIPGIVVRPSVDWGRQFVGAEGERGQDRILYGLGGTVR